MKVISHNQEETKKLAHELLKKYPKVKIWLLEGQLGSGKTSFVKGIARSKGLDENHLKSPTFSIIEEHGNWVHADLYRLEDEDAGIKEELLEYLNAGFQLFIEWPERLSFDDHLKKEAVRILFEHELGYSEADERTITINPPHSHEQ